MAGGGSRRAVTREGPRGGSTSGGGGGAPTTAGYVVTAADGTLSNETLIGAIILPAGTFAARPSAAGLVAGTIYITTDTDAIYRADGAGAWGSALILDQLAASSTITLDLSVPGQISFDQVVEEITTYTSGSNNYTAPTWATDVEFVLTACGGPGGSGRCDVTNTIRGGGGGGGHGEVVRATFPASSLAFPVACVVGAQGTVGASVSLTGTNGNPGVVGADTTITGNALLFPYLKAKAGAPGAGGTGAVGGAGGDNTIASQFIGMDGAKGGGDSPATDLTTVGGIGGGGGGGMGMTASANTISAGSNGGLYAGAGTPGLAGASNAAGAPGSANIYTGMGGGGGGRNTTGTAGPGGAGGAPGGGGGGGGSALFGQVGGSGAGGAGARGNITIIARR